MATWSMVISEKWPEDSCYGGTTDTGYMYHAWFCYELHASFSVAQILLTHMPVYFHWCKYFVFVCVTCVYGMYCKVGGRGFGKSNRSSWRLGPFERPSDQMAFYWRSSVDQRDANSAP